MSSPFGEMSRCPKGRNLSMPDEYALQTLSRVHQYTADLSLTDRQTTRVSAFYTMYPSPVFASLLEDPKRFPGFAGPSSLTQVLAPSKPIIL